MQKLIMILASTIRGEIGVKNRLPWKLRGDLARFAMLTYDNVIIMGRKTYESMGFEALSGRVNYIVSKSMKGAFDSIEQAIATAKENYPEKDIYLIGGVSIYEYGLKHADVIELTLVQDDERVRSIPYDAVIPDFHLSKEDWTVRLCRVVEQPSSNDSVLTQISHRYIRLERINKTIAEENE